MYTSSCSVSGASFTLLCGFEKLYHYNVPIEAYEQKDALRDVLLWKNDVMLKEVGDIMLQAPQFSCTLLEFTLISTIFYDSSGKGCQPLIVGNSEEMSHPTSRAPTH